METLVPQATDPAVRMTFEWGRAGQPADWLLPLAALAAVLVFVAWLYRRDAVELSRPVGLLLAGLRMATFVGLLVIYLEPQWRTERDVVHPSRVALLVDTSLSMGLTDAADVSAAGSPTRLAKVTEALAGSDLLKQLRRRHEVSLWRFDQELNRLGLIDRPTPGASPGAGPSPEENTTATGDWMAALSPRGPETRIGQALRQVLQEEGMGPLAGVVLVTDGGQNAGPQPTAALDLARQLRVPLGVIGIGSDRQPQNVRVADLLAPARAFPGDSYTVTAFLQAQGLAGREVSIELNSRGAEDGAGQAAAARQEGARRVVLGADGETIPVKFEIVPQEPGRRVLELRIEPPEGDHIPTDNALSADVEVVERKNRVLLVAGGPTREYQFARNQLHRDRDVVLDVWLQTAQGAISQDAHAILDDFPASREELGQYDCLIAFDPDWTRLSPAQVELLEHWVGEEAGGLIAVAGPIQTPRWTSAAPLGKIRDLYPVEFPDRFAMLDDEAVEGTEVMPLSFTREGQQSEFLWLGDSAAVSAQAWQQFPGVYTPYPVRQPKPGAAIYAHVGDARYGGPDERPPYWAGQFYGSGRVFFQASGEMWRLRQTREAYFDEFYTKLVRHVTQGRLLRGSSQGVLLVERERYLLGQTVLVRAQLRDARGDPLELPSVPLEVMASDQSLETISLVLDPTRAGNYVGQFAARQEGAYRMELRLPGGNGGQLVRRVQVRVPELERENPRRNDPLLEELAHGSEGRYYVGFDAALGATGEPPLVELFADRTKTVVLSGEPIRLWDNIWMMLGLCGLLCTEWLIRRLVKLA